MKNKASKQAAVRSNVLKLHSGLIAFAVLVSATFAFSLIVPFAQAEIWPSDEMATNEDGGNATFRVSPNVSAEYGGIIYMVAVPDKESNLGMGPGASVTMKATAVDGRWQVQKLYLYGSTQWFWDGYTVPINAQNDDQIEGTHTSKVLIGYRCDTDMSRYPPHKTRFTVTNTITDNDSEGNINGVPNDAPDYDPPCLLPETAGSLSEKAADSTTTKPSSNSSTTQKDTKQEEPSKGFLLNESTAYINGEGETLWLKPGEGSRFNLSKGDAVEQHSVTVNALGNNSANITIASDPIKATLQKDTAQAFDVDKDGTKDIEIKLVGISEGQAGLLFKPATDAAKVAAPKGRIADSTVQPTKDGRNYLWYIAAVVVVAALAGIWIYKKKRRAKRVVKSRK